VTLVTVATREDYFDAAMELLATEGFGAVKIATMCNRFGVTVGSFYHHFDNVEAFVDQLLDYWEEHQTQRVADLAAIPTDPQQRVKRMKELAISVPHAAEAAIRSWASVNAQVAKAQKRVDEHRRAALQEVLQGVIPDRRLARHLSIVGITLLVGLQQWRAPVNKRELTRLFDEFDAMIFRYVDLLQVEQAS
jgi:AcrR family transcriptional regulator